MDTTIPGSSADISPINGDLVVDTCDGLSPETLEQCREIFRMAIAGQTQEETAGKLQISRPAVA